MDAESFVYQKDSFEEFLPRFGKGLWFPACFHADKDTEFGKDSRGFYCALIPRKHIQKVLEDPGWDLHAGNGLPGFSRCGSRTSYHRFGNDDGIEPLVFRRSYHGLRPSHTEISEEFRHFHDLFLDTSTGSLIRLDYDDGSEEVVGRPVPGGYELRMRDVREFLAAKGMHLALFFDIVRFPTAGDAPERHEEKHDSAERLTYAFNVREGISRLLGKKLIEPLPRKEMGKWPFEKPKEPDETFIIGRDADGKPVEFTCDPEKLANYFGKNPDAPHYMTPVHFERSVLQHYYDHPERYTVTDGHLQCAGLWGMHIDNNHPERVVVALGDLGRDLPKRERARWKASNIPSEGGYSETAYRRAFKAEFADATRADLRFKAVFSEFQDLWLETHDWPLFLPLEPADAHFLSALRIPLVESQRELDAQLLGLAKILVDSLNEKELRARAGLPDDDPQKVRSLVLLERFMTSMGVAGADHHVDQLRAIQTLRSTGAAHRKGSNYEKTKAKLQFDGVPPSKIVTSLLESCCALLQRLMPSDQPTPATAGS